MIWHHNPVLHPKVFLFILGSALMMQKNVRYFKKLIKEQNNPFYVRCFLKLGILIFLVILGTASNFSLMVVTEYVLIRISINFIDKSFVNLFIFHDRIKYIANIAQSFRTVYNLYQHMESNISEVFVDRIESQAKIVLLN